MLAATPDGQYTLTQGWELAAATQVPAAGAAISQAAFGSANRYNTTIPGTVLTTLIY
jgi:hypothetical protein